jgi:glycosyltransferase involved in cell wall biosynthesis
MRLLVCTQAVDLDDPILGFFHRWIEAFEGRFDSVHVICLKEGRHVLPAASIHSLGKEAGGSRLLYVLRLYRYAWSLRREYDAVFIHMNEEYALLGALMWWVLGKRVVLWRNHKTGSWRTRLACRLVESVCHTSPEAFVARFTNAHCMPIGIDTAVYSPLGVPPQHSVLFLGRLDAVKNPDVFLQAMQMLAAEDSLVRADLYGDPTPGRDAYAKDLKERFALPNVTYHHGVKSEQTPSLYRGHSVFVNLTPSGSFDKTIGEALSSGCIVVAANAAVCDALYPGCFVRPRDPTDVARGISVACALTDRERAAAAAHGREFIVREHSLAVLVDRLADLLQA